MKDINFLDKGQRNADGEGYPEYVANEFRNLLGCGDQARKEAEVLEIKTASENAAVRMQIAVERKQALFSEPGIQI